jgi:hypothetical protein
VTRTLGQVEIAVTDLQRNKPFGALPAPMPREDAYVVGRSACGASGGGENGEDLRLIRLPFTITNWIIMGLVAAVYDSFRDCGLCL